MSKCQSTTSSRKNSAEAASRALAHMSVDSLAAHPLNPRVHGRQQVMAIARSIETFGFTAPILIDGMNRIVAGHGRLEAAKRLGLESVPVIRLEHLTDTQAKAYMLADNKLTDRSSWDDRKVAIVLKELSEIALDFEIDATGFEAPEIDLHIQSLESSDADAADEFEAPAGPPVSKLGDLWLLNDHRVLCGDALDPGAYKALLGDEKASSVFTDPPYNVRIKGHAGGKGRTKHREFPMASGEMTSDGFSRFLVEAFGLMMSHVADNATSFACMGRGATSLRSPESFDPLIANSSICAFGSSPTAAWGRYIAHDTNLSSCSASAAPDARTMCSSAGSAATARTSGTTLAPTPSPDTAERAVWIFTRP